eukprot:13591085-Alexandrium_andersonii.AAC.1
MAAEGLVREADVHGNERADALALRGRLAHGPWQELRAWISANLRRFLVHVQAVQRMQLEVLKAGIKARQDPLFKARERARSLWACGEQQEAQAPDVVFEHLPAFQSRLIERAVEASLDSCMK